MSKNERLGRVLYDHVALIRDAFTPQEEVIQTLAQTLVERFHQGGRLFLCAGGSLATVADLTANLFLYRLGFDRPALPAISLCHNVTLLHALGRDGLARQIFSRQLRPIANENDLLLIFADLQADPALNDVLATAQQLGMTTAAVVPAKISLIGEDPPRFVFRLDSTSAGRINEAAVVFGHLLCELVEADLFGH